MRFLMVKSPVMHLQFLTGNLLEKKKSVSNSSLVGNVVRSGIHQEERFQLCCSMDDEATQHHNQLNLDAYNTSCSSQRFSWCVVAAQAIVWESSGGRRGRKSRN
jgi:hypothetical protein